MVRRAARSDRRIETGNKERKGARKRRKEEESKSDTTIAIKIPS